MLQNKQLQHGVSSGNGKDSSMSSQASAFQYSSPPGFDSIPFSKPEQKYLVARQSDVNLSQGLPGSVTQDFQVVSFDSGFQKQKSLDSQDTKKIEYQYFQNIQPKSPNQDSQALYQKTSKNLEFSDPKKIDYSYLQTRMQPTSLEQNSQALLDLNKKSSEYQSAKKLDYQYIPDNVQPSSSRQGQQGLSAHQALYKYEQEGAMQPKNPSQDSQDLYSIDLYSGLQGLQNKAPPGFQNFQTSLQADNLSQDYQLVQFQHSKEQYSTIDRYQQPVYNEICKNMQPSLQFQNPIYKEQLEGFQNKAFTQFQSPNLQHLNQQTDKSIFKSQVQVPAQQGLNTSYIQPTFANSKSQFTTNQTIPQTLSNTGLQNKYTDQKQSLYFQNSQAQQLEFQSINKIDLNAMQANLQAALVKEFQSNLSNIQLSLQNMVLQQNTDVQAQLNALKKQQSDRLTIQQVQTQPYLLPSEFSQPGQFVFTRQELPNQYQYQQNFSSPQQAFIATSQSYQSGMIPEYYQKSTKQNFVNQNNPDFYFRDQSQNETIGPQTIQKQNQSAPRQNFQYSSNDYLASQQQQKQPFEKNPFQQKSSGIQNDLQYPYADNKQQLYSTQALNKIQQHLHSQANSAQQDTQPSIEQPQQCSRFQEPTFQGYTQQTEVPFQYLQQESTEIHPSQLKASPPQFVQVDNLASFKEGEDICFYIEKFENSFLGMQADDGAKITRLINKLQDVEHIYRFAVSHRRYQIFNNFKQAIIQQYAKSEDIIAQEFEHMQKEPNEFYCQFLDRMFSKLNVPGVQINIDFYLGEMYRKLPKQLSKLIKKSQTKQFKTFRATIMEMETSPTFQQLQHLENITTKLSQNMRQPNTYPPKPPASQYPPSTAPQMGGNNGRQQGYRAQVPGRQQGRNTGNKGVRIAPSQSWAQGQHQTYYMQYSDPLPTTDQYLAPSLDLQYQPPPPTEPYPYNQQIHPGEQSNEIEQEFSTYNCQILDTILEENEADLEGQIFETFMNHRYPTRSKRPIDGQGLGDTMQPEYSQSEQQQDQQLPQQNIQQQQNNTPQQQASTKYPTVQRGFAYMDYSKPSYTQIQKQVLEAQFAKNVRCLIDKGLFTDELGRVQLTRLKQSFEYPLSIQELENMLDSSKARHIPIYYENIENTTPNQNVNQFENNINEFCETVPFQNELYKTAYKVRQSGQLKVVNVKIHTDIVPAILDTGAVKTLIAASTVEHLQLHQYVCNFQKKPTVKGIASRTPINSYLKNIPISFESECLLLDIPIIHTSEFQILLGSNIIDIGLKECIIYLHQKKVIFKNRQTNIRVSMQIYVTSSNRILPTLTTDQLTHTIQSLFPNIDLLPGKFDLAIIDPPFQNPLYYTSQIKYNTLSITDQQNFGQVLAQQMKKNSILLCWTSCKKLPETLDLLNYWGFEFHNVLLVWVKLTVSGDPQMNLGFYSRQNVELLIMSTKGQVSHMRSANRNTSQYFYTLFDRPEQFLHSSKPTKMYDIINQIFTLPTLNCVEFFERKKMSQIQSEHFYLYGDEIPNYVQIPEKYTQTHFEHNSLEFPSLFVGHEEIQMEELIQTKSKIQAQQISTTLRTLSTLQILAKQKQYKFKKRRQQKLKSKLKKAMSYKLAYLELFYRKLKNQTSQYFKKKGNQVRVNDLSFSNVQHSINNNVRIPLISSEVGDPKIHSLTVYYNKFQYSVYFNGLCNTRAFPKAIGSYSWIVRTAQGIEIIREKGEVVLRTPLSTLLCHIAILYKFLKYIFEETPNFHSMIVYGPKAVVKQLTQTSNEGSHPIIKTTQELLKIFQGHTFLQTISQKDNEKAIQYSHEAMYSILQNYRNQQNQRHLQQKQVEDQRQSFLSFLEDFGNYFETKCEQPLKDHEFEKFYDMQDMDNIYKNDPKVKELFQKHFDLFDYNNQVGLAKNQVLKLNFKPNVSPPKNRMPRYDQEQLAVLGLTIEDWESKGLVKDGFTNFVFYPVIVKKRGVDGKQPLNKRYRICFNFQPLNELLEDEPSVQCDSEEIIAAGANALFICVIDLVMAHQQVGLHLDQHYLMGLWTPQGIKLSTRGQFGVLPIAKTFSKGIQKAIGHLYPYVRAYCCL